MRHGFRSLVAVLDWATRRVLAWRLSNTLTTDCCLEALEAALRDSGCPGGDRCQQNRHSGRGRGGPSCCHERWRIRLPRGKYHDR